MHTAWNQSDIQQLSEQYRQSTKNELLSMFPERTWISITKTAARYNIKRSGREFPKGYYAKNLLNESLQSYYWLGFLFADGSFTDSGKIILNLAEKDKNQIERFADFVKYEYTSLVKSDSRKESKKEYTQYRVQMGNQKVCNELRKKFHVNSRKTYNPVKLDNIDHDDKIIAMIIGIIDGDGCIRITRRSTTPVITIKMHGSWIGNLDYLTKFMSKKIGVEIPAPKIDKRGLAQVNWCNRAISRMLKEFIATHDLLVLERKWDAIKELPFSLSELREADFVNIKQMHSDGFSVDQIASVINTCHDSIYKIIKNK